jgi:hypothetical protein
MQTTLDCFPCFAKQALYTIQLATDDIPLQEKILRQTLNYLSTLDRTISPPENAVGFYNLMYQLSGCDDPFVLLKQQSTDFALRLRPYLHNKINASTDPLLTAIKFSMAGNVIDYGAHHDFDPGETLQHCLAIAPKINDYKKLKKELATAEKILVLADNCGEIVFDGLLIEQLGEHKEVTIAVKEKPIINDAVYSDAKVSALPNSGRIITNGTGCPGTPLSQCSSNFKKYFHDADLIISKGQGNFETLSENDTPMFFLLTVKCDVVARHITEKANRHGVTAENGDMILFRNVS